jgi:tyrosyl-tRNA synthetase
VNNADWLCELGYIEVLRDLGKHFSINAMIARDSVRDRLENREQGISYTEFSYMLLQAYDFLHLKRTHGCSVQLAGSDQYGNIVSGVDLIHRIYGREQGGEAFGLTAPLITGSDGKKIGKSEQGAIFLSADRTSPYAFYQYFVNVEDADVLRLLRLLTFLSGDELSQIESAHASAPHERTAHKALASHMTELVHGRDERERAEHASKALFGGDVRGLDARTLDEVFADVPHSEHEKQSLEGDGVALLELLTQTTLAASKREARQFLESGAVLVNGEKTDATSRLTTRDLLHGERILLRRGKKLWHATRFR